MRAILAAISICLVACILSSAAEARARHGYHHAHHYVGQANIRHAQKFMPWAWSAQRTEHRRTARYDNSRPRLWCGWFMRQIVGRDPGRDYNLASKWAQWGSNAGGPRVGAIVVWWHHVGKIVGGPDARGSWLILSGNDGNAVRTRYLAVNGAIGFRI